MSQWKWKRLLQISLTLQRINERKSADSLFKTYALSNNHHFSSPGVIFVSTNRIRMSGNQWCRFHYKNLSMKRLCPSHTETQMYSMRFHGLIQLNSTWKWALFGFQTNCCPVVNYHTTQLFCVNSFFVFNAQHKHIRTSGCGKVMVCTIKGNRCKHNIGVMQLL